MRPGFRLAMLSLVAVAATSCGGSGGSSSGSTTTGGLQTTQLGIAQVSFTSKPSSQIGISGQTVSVYGMAGATFPDVVVDPPQTMSNTQILFTGTFGENGMWTYSNGQINSIGGVSFGQVQGADWTHDGHILYVAYDTATSRYQLFECNYDGSSPHRLTSGTHIGPASRAVWSPLNNLIAYDDAASNIYTSSTTGTGEVLRISGGVMPCFTNDGKYITYQNNTNATISTVPVGGGASTVIVPSPANQPFVFPTYSPDGNFIIFTDYTDATPQPEIFNLQGGALGFITPANDASNSATFSPDGQQVAYILQDVQAAGYQSLVTTSFTGANLQTIVPANPGLMPKGPRWSPFPGPQRFVAGTVGTVMTNPSGFLFGQAGDKFGGFVAFTAKTPTSATITSEGTPTGTAPYTFDIHADDVASLSYTNGLYSGVTVVSTGNYTDVLVSVSGITGQISYIAPVLQKRSNGVAPKPAISLQSGNTVYTGSFASLYDAKGKNWAPSGLSQFRLDPKGKLIDFK